MSRARTRSVAACSYWSTMSRGGGVAIPPSPAILPLPDARAPSDTREHWITSASAPISPFSHYLTGETPTYSTRNCSIPQPVMNLPMLETVSVNFSIIYGAADTLQLNGSGGGGGGGGGSGTNNGSSARSSGNNGCIYCLSKVAHPRLARGESHVCGYKPYRCEICNYSTGTKGNLAIHEQSDRHLNNLQEYDQQQRLKYVHEQLEPRIDLLSQSTQPLPPTQLPQLPMIPGPSVTPKTPQEMNSPPPNFFQHLESFDSKRNTTLPPDESSSGLLESSNHSLVCQVCNVFTTDNVEELISHAEQNRIPLNVDFVNKQVTTHTTGTWYCGLCAYRSPLKANFQLHCKTEKHAQRLSLLLHIWEGKSGLMENPLALNSLFFRSNQKGGAYCQLRCLACGYFTCSVHKIRGHCQMHRHRVLAEAFMNLVRQRNHLMETSVGGTMVYVCHRCPITFISMSELMQHLQSSGRHELNAEYYAERYEVGIFLDFALEDGCSKGLSPRQAGGKESGAPASGSSHSQDHSLGYSWTASTKKVLQQRPRSTDNSISVDHGSRSTKMSSAPPTFSNTPDQRAESTTEPDPETTAEVSGSNDGQTPHPTLSENGRCPAQRTLENPPDGMYVTAATPDPVNVWMNDGNLQNSELIQKLAKLLEEQNMRASAPRTLDGFFAWFSADNSLCSFIVLWLKNQFPEMDSAISNEFIALILEAIAQQGSASGRFQDLRKLQQRQPFATCQNCSPGRSFFLPSSINLHCKIYHNEEHPSDMVMETVEKIKNAVTDLVETTQIQQSQLSPIKRGRTRLTSDQIEVLRSNFETSSLLTEETIASICEKTGLKEKVVKHWFRNAQFKERQKFKDDPQSPGSQTFSGKASDDMQFSESTLRPSTSTKRFRTPISSMQQAVLMQHFQVDQNPSRRQMDIISNKVNLPKRVVQVWFQNARSRERRTYVKYTPQHPQSPKPAVMLPSIQTPPWQLKETSSQAAPLINDLCNSVDISEVTNSLLDSSPAVKKWQQIFTQILTQMPPLGIIQPPTTVQLPLPAPTQSLPTQTPDIYEDPDSPLDLSIMPHSSNGLLTAVPQGNTSPKTLGGTVTSETRSENFCRRNRTSISTSQARFMQWFFQHHKTPTICECESIGRAIGLSRRVVQVWFQNQRAKEKKLARASTLYGETALHPTQISHKSQSHYQLEGNECKVCGVMIQRLGEEDTSAITEHIFSKSHIDRLFATICKEDHWMASGNQEKRPSFSLEPKLD